MEVAKLSLLALDVVLKLLPYCISLWKEHWKSTSYKVIDHEELHVLADLSMVSLLCLLK